MVHGAGGDRVATAYTTGGNRIGMGVRFQCPEGHKLHVKAELAGKRGICPECGAKFVVPSFSGGRVAKDDGAALAAPTKPAAGDSVVRPLAESAAPPATSVAPSPVATSDAASPPQIDAPRAEPAAPPGDEQAAWYVRPAAGGQYGPAPTEAFRQWIADGRVADDSWVWRSGWPDWRPGGEVIAELGASAAAPPATGAATGGSSIDVKLDLGGPASAAIEPAEPPRQEVSTAELRRAEMRRRRQRMKSIAILLGVVALVVAVAMAVVLLR